MNPDEFKLARKRLWNELVALHDTWEQYEYLFTESDHRIRLLNCCADWFFGTAQRVLMREVILGISRLTDPPTIGPYTNLVIASLLDDPALGEYPDLARELGSACDRLRLDVDPIRKNRDKYIAHLDFEAAVRPTEDLIPGIEKGLIGSVIQDFGEVYNLHGTRILKQQSSFRLEPSGSSRSLIGILERSEEWKFCQELSSADGPETSRAT